MIIPFLKFCHRSTLLMIEITMLTVFIAAGAVGFLFWKFSQGPVDMTFAADTVKRMIVAEGSRTDLQFDNIVAEWPKFNGPVMVGLSGVALYDHGKQVMQIPQLGIRISKAPLLIGLLRPEAVIVKGATVQLIRGKDRGVHLLVGESSARHDQASEQSKSSPPEDEPIDIKDIGEALFKGGNLPDYPAIRPLSNMERFSVQGAQVLVKDEIAGKHWTIPQIDFEVLRKENRFTIVSNYKTSDTPDTEVNFLLERDEENGSVRLHGEIVGMNASTLAQLFLPVEETASARFILNGSVEGELDKNWTIEKIEGDLSSGNGTFNLDGVLPAPLAFSDLSAHLSYDDAAKKILLHNTSVTVNKRVISLSGEKDIGADKPIFSLKLSVPETGFDEIRSFWPEDKRTSVAADWLTRRLQKGMIRNFTVTLPFNLSNPTDFDTAKIDGAFDYDGLTADYQQPMIPVTDAKGHATLKDDTLSIFVDSGKMDGLAVKKGQVDITHLTHPTTVGEVIIDADAEGDLQTVMDYITRDPLHLGPKLGFDPKAVKGKTAFHASVRFPALKDLPAEDVRVVVDAKINDLLLPKITHGLDLTGGPFDLRVGDGEVRLSGKGELSSRPIDLVYAEKLTRTPGEPSSTIRAKINADKGLREAFGVHLNQFIDGSPPVDVTYFSYPEGSEKLDIAADLTPAVLMFSPFSYAKQSGQPGTATCHAEVRNGEVQSIDDLKISVGKEGSVSGKLTFGSVGGKNDVRSGVFDRFALAGANHFALSFVQSRPDFFDVTMKGRQLDGRPFLGSGAGGGHRKSDGKNAEKDRTSVRVKVDVARIKTGNDKDDFLTSPDLSLETNAAGDVTVLDLKGKFASGSGLTVSIKPDAKGKSKLAIHADNAGEALAAMDLYDTMIGGVLDVRGVQMPGRGVNDIAGRAEISNFSIVKAPVLAKLINLLSLSGLGELLQNKGIEFQKLRSDFEWKQTPQGRVIAVKDGKTSGASIGLTFAGTINQDKKTTDLSGTFVPMSQINGFLGRIPLLGNLLTGGKNGGVIAATYSLRGNSDNPTTFINPLSVLTPGFLRSLLFENGSGFLSEVGAGDDAEPSAAPVEKKAYNR